METAWSKADTLWEKEEFQLFRVHFVVFLLSWWIEGKHTSDPMALPQRLHPGFFGLFGFAPGLLYLCFFVTVSGLGLGGSLVLRRALSLFPSGFLLEGKPGTG